MGSNDANKSSLLPVDADSSVFGIRPYLTASGVRPWISAGRRLFHNVFEKFEVGFCSSEKDAPSLLAFILDLFIFAVLIQWHPEGLRRRFQFFNLANPRCKTLSLNFSKPQIRTILSRTRKRNFENRGPLQVRKSGLHCWWHRSVHSAWFTAM